MTSPREPSPSASGVRALNDALTDLLSEMPRPPGKEDWVYRDLPKIRSDFFAQFLEMVGEENIEWITRAKYQLDGETYERGQLWVSPAGLTKLREHVIAKHRPGTTERQPNPRDEP